MCNKTDDIPVLALSDFSTDNFGFVMMPVSAFHHQFDIISRIHKQSYYTILFCQKGKGNVVIDKEVVTLQNNTVICTSPNSVSSWDVLNIRNGWIILFSESFFSMRYNDNVLYNFECLKQKNFCEQMLEKADVREWQFYMQLMSREYKNHSKDAKSLLRSYMNIILSILNRNNVSVGKPLENRSIKDKKILAFEQLIEMHYKTEKLPSFYADAMHISVNYLNRICQEKRAISSGEMIRKRVAIEAERLLFHTYDSISEIADKLGFESVSYFTTFFKKHTGQTPDSFRKLSK